MYKTLIVGLGNYPQKYTKTRHNVGFMVIDKLCELLSIQLPEFKNQGNFGLIDEFIIGKPLTLMNLSGDFVSQITKMYKITPENIIVIHDDIDTNVGTIKIRSEGSSGGHNGIKDIINKIGSGTFTRIKIGVGRPQNKSMDIASYVLSNFDKEELGLIHQTIEKVATILLKKINNKQPIVNTTIKIN